MNSAAVTPSSGATPTMKLLVHTASQRVLFAEAGKDVVDFLFGVLAMPVGAVASLLLVDGDDALGGFANVYASAEKMDAAFIQGAETRDTLVVNTSLPAGPSVRLLPTCASSNPIYYGYHPPPQPQPHVYQAPPPPPPPPTNTCITLQPPPLSDAVTALLPPQLYRCHACHALGTLQGCVGFVQGVATYTVMDDLTVAPTTNMSSIALLSKLGVKDIDALEERTVNVGRKECVEILKVSFRSKAVLTDVFLATKKRTRALMGTRMSTDAGSCFE